MVKCRISEQVTNYFFSVIGRFNQCFTLCIRAGRCINIPDDRQSIRPDTSFSGAIRTLIYSHNLVRGLVAWLKY